MVQVSFPGVYIVEVPSGVHTITGVSTSVAAFFGRAAKGPMDRAIRCFSIADFERAFGGAHPQSDLGQSVRMFFANGGTECYVVRLAAGAAAADVTMRARSVAPAPAFAVPVMVARAKSPGAWGNGLQLEVSYNTPQPDETFNLTVIHQDVNTEVGRETHVGLSMDPNSPRFAPAFVSASSELVNLSLHADAQPGGTRDLAAAANSFDGFSQGRVFRTNPIAAFRTEFEALFPAAPANFRFEISVDDSAWAAIDLSTLFQEPPAGPAGPPPPPVARTTAWTLANVAARLEFLINQELAAIDPGLSVAVAWQTSGNFSALRITSDTTDARNVRIRRAAAQDIAGTLMLGLNQGGIEPARFSNFRPVATASYFEGVNGLIALAGRARDDITSIAIDGGTPVAFSFATMTPAATDPWFLDSMGGSNGVREKLNAIAAAINATPTAPAPALSWRAEVWGYHLAIMARGGSVNAIPATVVSAANTSLGGTAFVRNTRRYALGPAGASPFQVAAPPPTPGDDGTAPTQTEYEGNLAAQTGFHALDPVDIFNLMVLPADRGVSEATMAALWGPASVYCQEKRAFLLVDPPAAWTTQGAVTRPHVVVDTSLIDTLRAPVVKENAAVFYPNVRYRQGGVLKTIGSSGMIAGLMARIDSTRGVWKAPAGLEAGLRAISDLEVRLTDRENGVLNKKAVNALRGFPSGFVCWGSRTMAGDDDFPSEWKYVPIRRFALFLEESLFRGTKWVVFEPNDEPLWANIRKNLRAFMMGLFRQGAFQGTSPDQAFFVKCDSETTTANDRNLGIVNIEVGFAPLKPAEFVVIKIQQIAEESE